MADTTNRKRKTASAGNRKKTATAKRSSANTRTAKKKKSAGDQAFTAEILYLALFCVILVILLCVTGVIGGAFGPGIRTFFTGLFGSMAVVIPVIMLAYMAYFVITGKTAGRLKLISSVFIVLITGMLAAFFAGTDFDVLLNGSEGRVKQLYEMQKGGGAFFGLPAVFFYKLFGKGGSYFILFMLLLIAILLFLGKTFFSAFQNLMKNMGSGLAEGYEEMKRGAEEFKNRMGTEEEEYYDDEEEPVAEEYTNARTAKRELTADPESLRARRNAKYNRDREEKRRRREEKEMERRMELERRDDERILSSSMSNRKTLKNYGPADDERGSLDDIHEITLLSDTQKIVFQHEAHIHDEMVELKGDPDDPGVEPEAYADIPEAYDDELPPEVVYTEESIQPEPVPEPEAEPEPDAEPEPEPAVMPAAPAVREDKKDVLNAPDQNPLLGSMPTPVTERTHRDASKDAEGAGEAKKVKSNGKYQPPSIELLEKSDKKGGGDSDRQLQETAALLQQTLKSFGVAVEVTNISQGPAVTRFELKLSDGIKVNKIVNLADDLKLNLAAQDIRIEAPIPGKAAVGVEIPNRERQSVKIRDLLDSREFKRAESKLSYVVGKDISGQIIVSDIAKMPHMLIAGSTGSGKSVFTNSIIMSLLYKARPDEVKLILIDPKIVEFSVYNGIPHLLLPVVTDPRQASAALAWAVAEMTRRYKLFAESNVRAIKAYNEQAGPGEEILPQIVIVVDELADLMMVASKEVEDSICRLAQLARAAGIHLIIATQRPSVDVITGLIKANMPSRVGLKVASGIDSRTILDMVGAERLLGNGDMLFYPQGIPKPVRVQGAFVTDSEVQKVVNALKTQSGDDVYDKEIVDKINNMSSGEKNAVVADEGGGSDTDALYADACRFVAEKEKASTSMLQRVFKVGFNRAARMLDRMETDGVVGPEEGTKPRKILMSRDELEQYINSL